MESNANVQSQGVPPPISPPPVISAPPPKPRKRLWVVFVVVLVCAVVFGVLASVAAFMAEIFAVAGKVPRDGGPRVEEVVLEDNGAVAKIAVIELDGVITEAIVRGGYTMVEVFEAQLKRAAADEKVKAVILRVNSPGGEALAADRISAAIREFQDKRRKPVVACLGSLAASGAYYVSAPCRWIVAHEMTITGSIGVMISTLNYRGLMDKVGLKPMIYKSGKYKDMLSGARPPDEITEEEHAMIQALIDEVYLRFKNVVAEGRKWSNEQSGGEGRALAANWEAYADGRVLSGREAYKHGFVDELGDFKTAVKRAKKLAGVTEANLVQYRQRVELVDLLGLIGPGKETVVKLDVGLERIRLEPGKLYFVAPQFFH
ncbi:MAG: signal peptide peptidase SppA [Verrucomicrobiae bacterium]|nr:signal peptide peptidase SppA [Verrucomicrobiae bacterium]